MLYENIKFSVFEKIGFCFVNVFSSFFFSFKELKTILKNSYQIGLKFLRYVGISSYHAEKRVLRKLATVGFLFD